MDIQPFVQKRFAEFYEKNSDNIEVPNSAQRREYGFILFKEKVMVRHKGFTEAGALKDFIKEAAPLHAYYSTAYYEAPEEKMEEKGWLGSDIFFDIDADHIPTKCNKSHDTWLCKECGSTGKGTAGTCPNCGSKRFDERIWPCDICLESARLEAIKLVDFLTKDFGFSSNDVKCSFSGHRGYHVHIENEEIQNLGPLARKEIVDYVTGVGAEANLHGLREVKGGKPKIIVGPKPEDNGWAGRMVRGTQQFLLASNREDLKGIGLKEKVANEIITRKDAILQSWKVSGPWNLIKGLSLGNWEAIVRQGIENQSARIDTVVTTDIHRLIRLANTLHGKTGLLKISFPTDDIEKFDPFKSAVAFKKGEATIYVEDAPQFILGEETFGPYNKQKVTLPMKAAIFLLCKEAAKVVE